MTLNSQTIGMVTIDVEPDSVWHNTQSNSLSNIESLKRFHKLCVKFEIRPTYLVTYSVVADKTSCNILESFLAAGNCEIGVHPHYWETPPVSIDDQGQDAWVGSHYSDEILEEKLVNLIEITKSRLVTPVSHRSGRWGMESRQVSLLSKNGIEIDTSVTPGIDWSVTGAYDYTNFLTTPYYLDSSDFILPGNSPVLEIPCSIKPGVKLFGLEKKQYVNSVLRRLNFNSQWLRPSPDKSPNDLLGISKFCIENFSFLNLMTHSSEFKSGCSPFWLNEDSIDQLFLQLQETFTYWNNSGVKPMTLKEFKQQYNNI